MYKLTIISLILSFFLGIVQITAQPLNNHLIFDGIDDYISLNNMDVSGNAITLEALVNSSDLSNCQYRDCRIISKASGLTTPDHYWMLSTNYSGANTVLRFRLKTNGNSTTLVATTGALSENTWYHVAATYDGAMMRLFLDGTEVGSTAKTGTLTTNSAVGAFIGANPPVIDNPWKGEIDEVRIWNTARTQAQIQANSSSELTGNETGLQTYYQFNEGSGQTINDQAGNNNTVLGSTSSADTNDPTFANGNPTYPIDLKVLLEGSYDPSANEMINRLETRNLIPNNQPFNQAPWYYNGNETKVIAQVSDWVLVSFRTEIAGNSEVGRAAGLVQLDGQVHFSSTNVLPSSLNTPVYIVIETRNHLTIMSPQPVAVNNGMLTYDFTTADSYTGGGRGQKQLSNGKWAMFSGDVNSDLDVNGVDRVLWAAANGSFSAYLREDLNFDGDVTGNDRIYWLGNNGIFSTVPKSDTLRTNAVLSCPVPNFVLNSCYYTVSWMHDNPLSTTVNYELRINGIVPGPSVAYPATFNSVEICNLLNLTLDTGSFDVELLYWYDGDASNPISAGTCKIDYNINGPSHWQGKTFAQIANDAETNFCDPDGDDAYIAEYLFKNPSVCYWNVVALPNGEKCVVPLDVPTAPAHAIQLPAPSGSDDTQALESLINGNPGGSFKGSGGTYRLNGLDVNVSAFIWNVPAVPVTSSTRDIWRINAPDVRIYDSPIDGQNSTEFRYGWQVQDGSDRFHLINSGLKDVNVIHGWNMCAIKFGAVDDFYIAGNTFTNILNISGAATTSRANAIWHSPGGGSTSGGYIVNNTGNNFQSNGPTKNAEFYTKQGFIGQGEKTRIFGNRCINAGNRFVTFQSGDALVLSNSAVWDVKTGNPGMPDRPLSGFVAIIANSDRVHARNNRFSVEPGTNGRLDRIFALGPNITTSKNMSEMHVDCNVVTINSNDQGTVSHNPSVFYFSSNGNSYNSYNQSSIKDNIIKGSGGIEHFWDFTTNGLPSFGWPAANIDISGNVFTIQWTVAEYE